MKPTVGVTPLENKYLYQGKLKQDELGLQLYDFHARQYDPQIGRFWGIDPADEFPSGYTGMGNDPANFIDPTGMRIQAAGGDGPAAEDFDPYKEPLASSPDYSDQQQQRETADNVENGRQGQGNIYVSVNGHTYSISIQQLDIVFQRIGGEHLNAWNAAKESGKLGDVLSNMRFGVKSSSGTAAAITFTLAVAEKTAVPAVTGVTVASTVGVFFGTAVGVLMPISFGGPEPGYLGPPLIPSTADPTDYSRFTNFNEEYNRQTPPGGPGGRWFWWGVGTAAGLSELLDNYKEHLKIGEYHKPAPFIPSKADTQLRFMPTPIYQKR